MAGNIAAIGQAITGFDAPGVTGGTMGEATGTQSNPTVDNEAFAQAQAAYTAASKDGSTRDLTGTDLGGLVLVAGVYTFDSSAQLTGTLTLNGLATDVFIFQIGSTLTTASGSAVVLTGGAQACNVYFQVGSSATLGTATNFNGNILAQASITLTTGASTNGGLYALTGAVTLDTNIINAQVCSASTTSTTATATATSTATSTSTSPSTSSTTATTATSVSTTITTTGML